METAVVRLSMPGGVGGQRRKPLPTRLSSDFPMLLKYPIFYLAKSNALLFTTR